MQKWKRMELNKTDGKPEVNKLVAIRLQDKSKHPFASKEQYDIGYFHYPDNGKKLYWHCAHGNLDLVALKQHNDIWWCPVTPFDGI